MTFRWEKFFVETPKSQETKAKPSSKATIKAKWNNNTVWQKQHRIVGNMFEQYIGEELISRIHKELKILNDKHTKSNLF